MFADDRIEFNGNGRVFGYDSTNLAAGATQPGVCGNVASVELQGNYTLNGDVHMLPGGRVRVTGSSRLNGSASPMASAFTLPRPRVPAATRAMPAAVGGVITLTSGLPYLVSGDFEQHAHDEIRLTGTDPIEIYTTADFSLNGEGVINTTRDPHLLTIHNVGTNGVHINGNSAFYGTIDAPDSEVELNGNGNVYGSVIGSYIHHNGNNQVYLDTSLADDNSLEVPAPGRRTRLEW